MLFQLRRAERKHCSIVKWIATHYPCGSGCNFTWLVGNNHDIPITYLTGVRVGDINRPKGLEVDGTAFNNHLIGVF